MTETTKHTPGPWIYTPFHLKYLSVHADSGNPHLTRGRICEIDGEHEETKIHPLKTRDEVEANAQLIAAAPELYNALATIIKRGYALDASDHALAIDALHKAFCTQATQSTTGAHI